MLNKLEKIHHILEKYPSFAVTFSGGIDSTLLLYLAWQMFPGRVQAVTVLSPTLAATEQRRIAATIAKLSVKHTYLSIDEFANANFVRNDKARCYWCKKNRIEQLSLWAKEHNIAVLLDGSNTDDLGDYRPGMQAAKEAGEIMLSPFLLAEISKAEIRSIAKDRGIEFWDLPSSACLASRIEYGLELNTIRLTQVEAAENFLKQYLSGNIRVRHHGELARIEAAPDELSSIFSPQNRTTILKKFHELGFTYVTVDLAGYQTGSMNLKAEEKIHER